MGTQSADSTKRQALPVLVEDSRALAEVSAICRDASQIAIDIESNGYHHYVERTCILSLSTPEHDFVIDSLSLWDELGELREVLCDGQRKILVHGGSYDVLSLKRDFNFTFPKIADSLLAAQLLGFEVLGLAGLVKMREGIELPKELQRHDWAVRPLDPVQLTYLANDTRYLFDIIAYLESEIAEHELSEELELEYRALAETEYLEKTYSPEESVEKLKDARRLPPSVRGILKALFAWRDEVARYLDLAPFRVIGNNVILNLAQHPPKSIYELDNRRGLGRHVFDAGLDTLFEAIDQGKSEPFPFVRVRSERASPRRNHDELRTLAKALKSWRNAEAEERHIGIQGVLPTPALKAIGDRLPTELEEMREIDRLGDARIARYGEKLLEIVAENCASSLAEKASSS